MVRIKRGNIAAKRRKKYLKLAKGYVGSNSKLSTFASEQVIQSLNFSYIGRKLKKRTFRKFWIYHLNAISRLLGTNYSSFIGNLKKKYILIDRKMLSSLSIQDPFVFNLIYKQIFNAV